LVSGSLLDFVRKCLREGNTWKECKTGLLEEYFPHFVRERLIRDMIVFNFHEEREPLLGYVERISRAAKFFEYQASEEQIVGRVIMNFHPSVLAHTALLGRPQFFKDLYRLVRLIEEEASIERERLRGSDPPRAPAKNNCVQRDHANRTRKVRDHCHTVLGLWPTRPC
jgi:hypothetical protein